MSFVRGIGSFQETVRAAIIAIQKSATPTAFQSVADVPGGDGFARRRRLQRGQNPTGWTWSPVPRVLSTASV